MTQKNMRDEVRTLRKETEDMISRLVNLESLTKQFLELAAVQEYQQIDDEQKSLMGSDALPQTLSFSGISPTLPQLQLPPIPAIPPSIMKMFQGNSDGNKQQNESKQIKVNYFSSSNNGIKRYWDISEHHKFLEAVQIHGLREAAALSAYIGSRNIDQVRSHAQKYQLKVEKILADARQEARQRAKDLEQALWGGAPPFQPRNIEEVRQLKTLTPLGQIILRQFPEAMLKRLDPMFLKAGVQDIFASHELDGQPTLPEGDCGNFLNWGLRDATLVKQQIGEVWNQQRWEINAQAMLDVCQRHGLYCIARYGAQFCLEVLIGFINLCKAEDPIFFVIQNLRNLEILKTTGNFSALLLGMLIPLICAAQ